MRAMVLNSYGGPEVLEPAELHMPQPGPGEVLVRVSAISVNPVDTKARKGNPDYDYRDFPVILGWDVAGTVEVQGPDTGRFKASDRVFGMIRFPKEGRADAEFVTAPEGDLALMPDQMSFEEAAATTLAALTAQQALDKMNLRPGQTLLVQSASGGVGHFAVQLAKAKGARVIGTSSGKNREFVLGLGADDFVDYNAGPFEEAVERLVGQVDAVLDAVGGETFKRSYAVVKPGGWLVTLPAVPDPHTAPRSDIHAERIMVHTSAEGLAELAELYTAGKLKPHISKTLPLEHLAEAHRLIEEGHTIGKIVLTVK